MDDRSKAATSGVGRRDLLALGLAFSEVEAPAKT